MDIETIDHVEFHVGDARRAALYLCSAFGLRRLGEGGPGTGLPDQRSVLIGQGGIRLLLTSAMTATHPVGRWARRHGDGVGCLALRTGDARAAVAEAAGRGARVVAEPRVWRDGGRIVVAGTVSGPGELTHRFVERHGPDAPFLPGVPAPLPPGAAPAGDTDLLETVDHVALCVPAADLGPAAGFYEDVLGFRSIFTERLDVGGQAMDSRVVQSPSAGVTITIVAPGPGTHGGQLDDFLRTNGGSGVQHLALGTRDIVAAVRALRERGVRFLSTPDSYYDAVERRMGAVDLPVAALRAGGILVDRDHWGQLFQIFTESPFERRTFFFELIERHGALTFGSNNIRALYEAKERDRAGAEVRL